MSLVILAGLLLGVIDGRASGFSWFTFDGSVVVWSDATDTRWLSEATFPVGSDVELVVLAAAGAWNITGGSSWAYTAGQATISPPDAFDGFSYTEAVPAAYFDDPNTLAVTLLGNIGAEWVDMDTLFNADGPNNWQWNVETAPGCEVLTDPATYGFVFMQVAMHEFGHGFGLGHEDGVLCMMNTYYPSGGTFGQENVIEPHADDRLGQRALYPGGVFTDLGNANFYRLPGGASAPIYFTPATAGPGDEITLRIQIENLGTTTINNVLHRFYLSSDQTIDTDDILLATLTWEVIEGGAAGQFDVSINLPDELASGTYHLGSFLDDTNDIAEAFEDNNVTAYCQTLTITLLAPVVVGIPGVSTICGQSVTGPMPTLTQPLNMEPTTWTLEAGPPGMIIDPDTGVVTWLNPTLTGSPHLVTVRAANAAGDDESSFLVTVNPTPPEIVPIADQVAGCGVFYTGHVPTLAGQACSGPVFPWTLIAGPLGMFIDLHTGMVIWPEPTAAGSPHTVTIKAFGSGGSAMRTFLLTVPQGDTNGDRYVDLSDYAHLTDCFTGPGGGVVAGCTCSDQDGDGDADLVDFARFQASFSDGGP